MSTKQFAFLASQLLDPNFFFLQTDFFQERGKQVIKNIQINSIIMINLAVFQQVKVRMRGNFLQILFYHKFGYFLEVFLGLNRFPVTLFIIV
jgi:hypothetical protein